MSAIESGAGGAILATVGPITKAVRVEQRPIISATLGEYQMALSCLAVAAQAAGIRAAFRYGGANLCLVEKIIFDGAGVTTAALTAGQALGWQAIMQRAYTVNHATGGANVAVLTGNNGKLRTAYSPTGVVDFRIANAAAVLSAGTSTPDAQPFGQVWGGLLGVGDKMTEATLFDQYEAGHPQMLAQNEGFTINMPVASPAAGAIAWGITVKWTEVTVAEWVT